MTHPSIVYPRADVRSRLAFAALFACLAGAAPAAAAPPIVEMQFDGEAPLHLELPLLDVPANTGLSFPSMAQSLWITADLYELVHFGISRMGRKTWYGFLTESAFDATTILVSVPFFAGWQHEEWHRAVLTTHGIATINPYYSPPSSPLFSPKTIAIDDRVVASLKENHPAGYVRGLAAGFEGQYALATQLEKNAFFYDQPNVSSFMIAMTYAMTSVYMVLCDANPTGTGDCTLWTDGLFAPQAAPHKEGDEPPPEQRAYLRRQMALSFLNFADPFLFMVRDLRFGDTRLSAAVRHIPAAFGEDIRLDVFYRDPRRGLFFSLHNFVNGVRWFPGVGVELVRARLGPAALRAKSELWLQPDDQGFFSTTPRPGIDVVLRIGAPLARNRIEPWVELEGKTAGWVTGNVFTEPNASLRLGLSANLF
jgi:hypothetical protein